MPKGQQRATRIVAVACALSAVVLVSQSVSGDAPGRGQTGPFEVAYLKFIIDHHFSALRITELAAGTDATRDPEISPAEGTSPSPGFEPSPAKATLPDILSLARRNNRMQREEILTAQMFLRDWYGLEYTPRLRGRGRALIALLEQTPAGPEFDRAFLQVFSRHHYQALRPTVDCLVGHELTHAALDRYCNGIVHAQKNDIDDMRDLLCRQFGVCDFQPFRRLHIEQEETEDDTPSGSPQ
jgi:uncharacterized protein (DUF305 family)